MKTPQFCLCLASDRAQVLFEQLLGMTLVSEGDSGIRFTSLSFPVIQVAHRLVASHCQARDLQRSLERIAEWVDRTSLPGGSWPSEFMLAGHPEAWTAYACLDGALFSLRTALDAVMAVLSLIWPAAPQLPRSFADFVKAPAKWREWEPNVFDSALAMWEAWGSKLRDYRDSLAHGHYAYHQS